MDEFIRDLIRKGFTAKTIKSRCSKQGWEPTNEQIETIRGQVELEIKAEQRKQKINNKSEESSIISLFNETETYFDFAKRIGVNVNYQTNTELITSIQKITAEIFLRQSLCYLKALELLSEGVTIDLSMFIKGYEISLRAVCLAWGIQNLIDVNAAFQTLESKGYLKQNHALSEISKVLEYE